MTEIDGGTGAGAYKLADASIRIRSSQAVTGMKLTAYVCSGDDSDSTDSFAISSTYR